MKNRIIKKVMDGLILGIKEFSYVIWDVISGVIMMPLFEINSGKNNIIIALFIGVCKVNYRYLNII